MDKLKRIIEWSQLKIKIELSEQKNIYFYEREVWWASLGCNIGFEQDGKNANFERPVLVIKKFSRDLLWVLPLTTKNKNGPFYHSFEFQEGVSTVILSQLRSISSKRLKRKMGKITFEQGEIIRQEIKKFL